MELWYSQEDDELIVFNSLDHEIEDEFGLMSPNHPSDYGWVYIGQMD